MNHEKLEQYILLRQSGELGDLEQRELAAYLSSDAKAQQLAVDYDAIIQAASLSPEELHVSELTVERIKEAGRPGAREEPTRASVNFAPMMALAAAIALLLAVGVAVQKKMGQPDAPVVAETLPVPGGEDPVVELAALVGGEIDPEFSVLEAKISQVSDELFGDNFWGEPVSDDLDYMASELLELESQI
jgi:anti-sigma factor RsiW